MNEWLNAHWLHIAAIAFGFALRWGAMSFMANATAETKGKKPDASARKTPEGKWNKARIIKFLTLFFVFCAGLMLAYGAYPLAQWAIGWTGTLGGIASSILGVATIAAGWHALHGMVALGHDMVDGTPDKEAFGAALWVPTTLPLGWAALVGLFTNPRGVATGLAVVAVSLVTAVYAHKILNKMHNAKGHYGFWMYLSTIICIFVGIAHIPALIYLNDLAGALPEWATWLARSGAVIAGVLFFLIGLGDWLRDRIPEKWTQWAAMYTIPVFTVLGVSVATLSANAESSLTTIFSTFG